MTRTLMATVAATALLATAAAAQDAQNMIDTSNVTVDGATVTFPSIMASEDGYVVLHEVVDGEVVAPASIGSAPIVAGENTDVALTADMALEPGAQYAAMLHAETNDNGTYDFGEGSTDVDTPIMEGDQPVVAGFSVPGGDAAEGEEAMESGDAAMQSGDMMPAVVTGVMIDGDTVTIPRVVAEQDGYVVIHAMLDGEPVVPASIGHAPVTAGVNENVQVTIEYPFVADETYMAMLHAETNGNDSYDFGEGSTDVDTPVMRDGGIVASVFDGS